VETEPLYQCPDETQPIGRAVHLGRLAAFYPACAQCRHRNDTATLSPRRVEWLNRLARHTGGGGSLFGAEGISGVALNELDPPTARRVGQAFGLCIAKAAAATSPEARIAIAGDGRPWSAELLAAAAQGVQSGGCRVVDAGSATAPALLLACRELDADGALLVGNASGDPQRVGITMWGPEGVPFSTGGRLDDVRQLFDEPQCSAPMPSESTESFDAGAPYLGQLREFFHALRPLRVIVETTSTALIHYLKQLASGVAVELIWNPPGTNGSADPAERLARIGRHVRQRGAHFGLWIDGDGECCQAVDERGEAVATETLLLLFAREAIAQQLKATIVIGGEGPDESLSHAILREKLPAEKIRIVTCTGSREAIWQSIRQHEAALAADREGRFWFAGPPTSADALKAFALLLVILSRGDAPLSVVSREW